MAINIKTLKGDQLLAYKFLVSFWLSEIMEMVFNGFAGTGKTYLLSMMAKSLAAKSDDPILLCAPTNKAAKQIAKAYGKLPEHVHVRTVHSSLGLIVDEKIDKNVVGKAKLLKFCEYKLVIIDECSMITDEVYQHINDQKVKTQKIIYTGDRLQLPPVQFLSKEQRAKRNGVEESLTFSTKAQVSMEKIIRQGEGHPVIDLGTRIRENINLSKGVIADAESKINSKGEGVYKLSKAKVVAVFVALYKKRDAYAKLVAFTNKAVDEWTMLFRKAIYGNDVEPYLQGEELVLHAPYHSFHNGDEFKIRTITNPHVFKSGNLEVKCVYINEATTKIRVPVDYIAFRNLIQKLQSNKEWQLYFDLKQRIATVSHTYASTVHKAQGSTVSHIFVDVVNIGYVRDVKFRNQLLYVAVTRPTKLAYLIV